VSDTPPILALAGGSFFSARHPPAACLVAEADGVVVGYVRVQPVTPLPENAHVAGIAGLAVAPAARGRGVASALLAAAARHARAWRAQAEPAGAEHQRGRAALV
jgi:predicted N-acetyltransferase YhbS